MAQGYTGYTILENQVTIKDSPNLDAFSRLRVSNPLTVFSNQFTYDLSPLVFEEYGSGSYGVTHNTNDRSATIGLFGAPAGDFIYMQSYEYIPYQPGRSQIVFITFNMFPISAPNNDTIRTVGLGDNDNGFFFRYNGTLPGLEFVILSSTTLGSQSAVQANWNLDKLDGTGPSGIALNEKETQILVIDFQALYVGRVRFGFDIDGEIIYAHEFTHANTKTFPYIATANLPIRVGMFALNSTGSEQMEFICCSVASEGGLEDAQRFGYTFSQEGGYLTLPNTSTHLMSIRPTTTFNSYTNRIKIVLQSIEIVNIGNRALFWSLGIGATLSGASYSNYNTTYSGVEIDTTGAFTSSPAITINSGYLPATIGSGGTAFSSELITKYPITLDALGNPRDFGTLTLSANTVGTGTTDVYYVIKWKEIR